MKKKLLPLILIVIISGLTTATVVSNAQSDPWGSYYIQALSDVDDYGSIGLNNTPYTHSWVLDGAEWNLTEEWQDYQANSSFGYGYPSGGGGPFFRFRENWQSFSATDRKQVTHANIGGNVTVNWMAVRMHARNVSGTANTSQIRMMIYNSSTDSGSNSNPLELLGQTEVITINSTVNTQWSWNLTMLTPVNLVAGRYWIGVQWDQAVRIRKSALIYLWQNRSARNTDAFWDGPSDPFGNSSTNKDGSRFHFNAHYNHTLQSYQMNYEFQFQNVTTNFDNYHIEWYGWSNLTTEAEQFELHSWDADGEFWEFWGTLWFDNWRVRNNSKIFYKWRLFQNVYSNTTFRWVNNKTVADNRRNALFIDWFRLYGWNTSIDVEDVHLTLAEPYNPGDGFVPFQQNPVRVDVVSGANFSVGCLGGTPTVPNYIWVSNSSDPNDALLLYVWGTYVYPWRNVPYGDGYSTVYLWFWCNVPSGTADVHWDFTVRVVVTSG